MSAPVVKTSVTMKSYAGEQLFIMIHKERVITEKWTMGKWFIAPTFLALRPQQKMREESHPLIWSLQIKGSTPVVEVKTMLKQGSWRWPDVCGWGGGGEQDGNEGDKPSVVVVVNMDGSASCLTFHLLSFLEYFALRFGPTAPEHRLYPSPQPAPKALGSFWLLFRFLFYMY